MICYTCCLALVTAVAVNISCSIAVYHKCKEMPEIKLHLQALQVPCVNHSHHPFFRSRENVVVQIFRGPRPTGLLQTQLMRHNKKTQQKQQRIIGTPRHTGINTESCFIFQVLIIEYDREFSILPYVYMDIYMQCFSVTTLAWAVAT